MNTIESTKYFKVWKAHSGLAQSSITVYSVYLRQFGDYLEKLGFTSDDFENFYKSDDDGKTDPIDDEFLKNYMEQVIESSTDTSQAPESTALALRSFFRTLHRQNYLSTEPSANLPVQWVHRRPRTSVFTDQEMSRLYRVAHLREPVSRKWDVLVLLLNLALRNSEIRHMPIDALDFRRKEVRVIRGTKGGKPRFIPMSTKLYDAASNYVQHLRLQGKNNDDLLFEHNGHPMHGRHLNDFVKALAAEAGIKKHTYPHMFRHTVLTRMYRTGLPLTVAQNFAGHSDQVTTMMYVHVPLEDQRSVLENAPIGQMLDKLATEAFTQHP